MTDVRENQTENVNYEKQKNLNMISSGYKIFVKHPYLVHGSHWNMAWHEIEFHL